MVRRTAMAAIPTMGATARSKLIETRTSSARFPYCRYSMPPAPFLRDASATSLRAWIFNHYAAEPRHPAGTRHYDLARAMRHARVDATIFAAGFNHFTGREEKVRGPWLWRTEVVGEVPFVWVRTPPYSGNGARRAINMAAYSLVVAAAQAALRTPDVIIGSSIHPFAALAAHAVARVRRRPFVFEIRDLWPQTLVDMGAMRADGPSARLLYAIERRLVERSDAVVTLLPGVEAYLDERRLVARRLAYIPNGVRPAERQADATGPAADAIRLVADWHADGATVFGYTGAHGRANGLDVLLDAMHRARDRGSPVRLLIVGDGPEKPRLKHRAAVEGLDTVRFVDPLPKRDIAALLTRLDAGVLHLVDNPVFRYGISSNKLFDYLGSGLPVVFACASAYDPVARAGAGVSLAPDDPSALAEAMGDIARRSPAERAAMGRRGLDYVRREHDLAVLADRLADLLHELVGAAMPGKR